MSSSSASKPVVTHAGFFERSLEQADREIFDAIRHEQGDKEPAAPEVQTVSLISTAGEEEVAVASEARKE